MPGLVPGIHVLISEPARTWMAGTSPAMTQPSGDLSRAYRREEFVDLGLQPLVLVRQELSRREYLRGGRSGVAGAAVDVGDGGRNLGGADRGLLDAAGDFLGGGALFLDGGCHGA